MLFSRGLQPPDYRPTLFDVTAAAFRLFHDPPISISTAAN